LTFIPLLNDTFFIILLRCFFQNINMKFFSLAAIIAVASAATPDLSSIPVCSVCIHEEISLTRGRVIAKETSYLLYFFYSLFALLRVPLLLDVVSTTLSANAQLAKVHASYIHEHKCL
jgi:hypothetical protein